MRVSSFANCNTAGRVSRVSGQVRGRRAGAGHATHRGVDGPSRGAEDGRQATAPNAGPKAAPDVHQTVAEDVPRPAVADAVLLLAASAAGPLRREIGRAHV